jgi:stage II sporulation protein E
MGIIGQHFHFPTRFAAWGGLYWGQITACKGDKHMELKLRTSASETEEKKKQPAPVVLKAPWVALAGNCATRFLLGAVLAAGNILGGYSPFALGFVAASGPGAGGLFALLGAGLGYLLTQPLAEAFRYLATAVLIYAVAFAFYDLKLYAKRFFMPLCAAGMEALTGFVYLAERGWSADNLVCYLTEIALVALSARAFILWRSEQAQPNQRRMGMLVALSAAVISLQSVPLPFGVQLGGVVTAAVILWSARYLTPFACVALSAALGLCLDLAAGGGAFYASACAVGGLLCVAGARWGRHLGVVSLLAGVLSVSLWNVSAGGDFRLFWATALGCALYLALPLRWVQKIAQLVPPPEGPPPVGESAADPQVKAQDTASALEAAQERLKRQGAAFRTLYEQISDDLAREPEPKPDSFALLQRAAKRVCPGCVFHSTCWKRELAATRKALAPVEQQLSRRGRADPGDFPVTFSVRCARLNELVNAINREYAGELTRRRYQLRLRESRRSLCRQYQRMARLLGECALSLEPKATQVMGSAAFSALAGVAAGKRPGQSVSGDAGGWFRDETGVLWVVLCDGMGSGPEAARDSRFAYRLLEQFLSAGIGPEAALATLGGALALRWECTGSFTTVDLLELDLKSGAGAVYKLGAGPTYLRRDGALTRIVSSTLPAGLQKGGAPDVSRFRLGPGDLAVLVSDGVTDGSEDEWVRQQIRAFQSSSPKELAAALVEHGAQATDDRTAIVLLIEGQAV